MGFILISLTAAGVLFVEAIQLARKLKAQSTLFVRENLDSTAGWLLTLMDLGVLPTTCAVTVSIKFDWYFCIATRGRDQRSLSAANINSMMGFVRRSSQVGAGCSTLTPPPMLQPTHRQVPASPPPSLTPPLGNNKCNESLAPKPPF
jgi:hypothetical protein